MDMQTPTATLSQTKINEILVKEIKQLHSRVKRMENQLYETEREKVKALVSISSSLKRISTTMESKGD